MENPNEILGELQKLNATIEYQYSFRRMFWSGVIYGVGFFLGSAVLAVVLLGIFGPYLAGVQWFQRAFQTGHEILHQ